MGHSCQSAATSEIVKRCCSSLVSSAIASTQTLTLTFICHCCRFIAVTQPIRYSKQKGSSRAYLALIALTWVISVAVSSPIAFGMNYTEQRRLTPNLCTFYNSDFLIYSSMASFYIPCIVMLVLYCKMFRSIRQMARRY